MLIWHSVWEVLCVGRSQMGLWKGRDAFAVAKEEEAKEREGRNGVSSD